LYNSHIPAETEKEVDLANILKTEKFQFKSRKNSCLIPKPDAEGIGQPECPDPPEKGKEKSDFRVQILSSLWTE